MCNRVRASFEFREIKLRWDLINDLPQFKPIYNVSPGRKEADVLAIVRGERGNEGPAHVLATNSVPRKKHEAFLQHDECEGRTAARKPHVSKAVAKPQVCYSG